MTDTRTIRDRARRRGHRLFAATVLTAGLVAGAAGAAGADDSGASVGTGVSDATGVSESDGARGDVAPARASTIVAVRGGYGAGFTVVRLDRTRQHLPTLSESMAECGEYHARGKRVRCWAETRTHYAGLMDLRAAINYQKRLRHDQSDGHGGHGGGGGHRGR